MKPRNLGFCFLLSAFCFQAWGQYSVDWSTIEGGGGTSTGGVYSVSGTMGQPDAVTWASTSTGWTLQQNTNNISSVNWNNVTKVSS